MITEQSSSIIRPVKRLILAVLGVGVLCSAGCASYSPSVVKNPVFSDLSYSKNGTLFYKGEEVDCIKLKRPWYIAMLPDDAYQWAAEVAEETASSLRLLQ